MLQVQRSTTKTPTKKLQRYLKKCINKGGIYNMYNLAVYLFLFYAIVCLFQIDKIERQEKQAKLNKKIFDRQLEEERQKQQFLSSIKY